MISASKSQEPQALEPHHRHSPKWWLLQYLQQCRVLETILPARPSKHLSDMALDDCEETTMHDVNIKDEMRSKQHQQHQEEYDEDDDEPLIPRVPCAHQY